MNQAPVVEKTIPKTPAPTAPPELKVDMSAPPIAPAVAPTPKVNKIAEKLSAMKVGDKDGNQTLKARSGNVCLFCSDKGKWGVQKINGSKFEVMLACTAPEATARMIYGKIAS